MAKQLPYSAIHEIFTRFRDLDAEPKGELDHVNAYTLVVAVALSAQATDVGVNRATRALFKIADTPEKMLALGEAQMIDLLILATERKLTALVEVHDYESLIQVKSHVGFPHPGYQLLGINNRNLKTFEVTLDTTRKLSKLVPHDRMIVCESGLNTSEDLADMARYGARTFLIGESLMRQDDVTAATRTLLANPPQGGM